MFTDFWPLILYFEVLKNPALILAYEVHSAILTLLLIMAVFFPSAVLSMPPWTPCLEVSNIIQVR